MAIGRQLILLRLEGNVLEVRVGRDNGRSFRLHEALVSARSDFFAAALTGQWKEAKDKIIDLPEDDPDIFALYPQLLYTGKIPVKEQTQEGADHTTSSMPGRDGEERKDGRSCRVHEALVCIGSISSGKLPPHNRKKHIERW